MVPTGYDSDMNSLVDHCTLFLHILARSVAMQLLLVLTIFGPLGMLAMGANAADGVHFVGPLKQLEPFFMDFIFHRYEKAAGLLFLGGCLGVWRMYKSRVKAYF